MRILLVNPPVRCSPGLNLGTKNEAQTFHMGLLYLAAMLEAHGHAVSILDFGAQRLNDEETKKKLQLASPDLIGITATTPSFRNALALATLARNLMPSVQIAMGGYHATFFATEILERVQAVDFVCRGESEYTLLELADHRPLAKISGLTYRSNKTDVISNAPRQYECDLDVFPFPARHLVSQYEYGSMGGVLYMGSPEKFTSLITSRGCPYGCKYCCVGAISGRRYRTRSVVNIEKEIASLVDDGIDTIYIQDDNFAINRNLPTICEMLEKYSIKWYCLVRGDTNPRYFRMMAAAGCRAVYIGVESFSEKILKFYGKNMTVEQITETIRGAKKSGLDVMVSLMLGAPVETQEELATNIEMITQLDIDVIELNILTYFPYTTLWNRLESRYKEWDKELLVTDVHPEMNLEQLYEWCNALKRKFYFRKDYLLRQILRTMDNRRDLLRLNLGNIPNLIRYLLSRKKSA